MFASVQVCKCASDPQTCKPANLQTCGLPRYAIPFEWTMGGDWVVTVDVTLADGRTASRQFDLSITGQMDMQEMDNE